MTLRLWLLRPRQYTEDRGYEHGLWDPWYDKCFGLVVRAENEQAARQLAAQEDDKSDLGYTDDWGRKAWLDAENSTCAELTVDGEPEVIIKDGWAA